MLNHLALVPGSAPEHGVHFWEPTVDGVPVRRLLRFDDPEDVDLDVEGLGPAGDNLPVFVRRRPTPWVDDVLALLGERPAARLDAGRVPLFVCRACGDLECGAITMRVERDASTVAWRDFRWETGPDDPDDRVVVPGGPFVFDRAQHDGEVRRFVDSEEAERAALPVPAGSRSGGRRTWRRWWHRG
ncbi:hypothetical protein [Cellulomonas sp. PS-H5]|uniref:hypothetical protein n=1 Tax=Cellulomonas sp. PS-H5 TaxID=2820400 RepID=UPI001C4E3CBC|nr:hypothetical protein [Cellulomonas sp. PS-H5]MBW0253886.1 hypothetical protein [Cellulomonas sp. PS-H5]